MSIGQNVLSLQHILISQNMSDEKLTYAQAIEELEQIVQTLQRPDCDIDQLCQLTQRSVTLLTFCKEKLTKTDEELAKLLDGLA